MKRAPRSSAAALALAVTLACPGARPARPATRSITRLPAEALAPLGAVARRGDVALVESNPDGTMKQVTLFLYVAAPPVLVHEVVAHPSEYARFVPNLARSTFERRPDGSAVHRWRIELPVSSFEGEDAYRFEPGATGAVELTSARDDASYRWEMLPAPGGTLLVQYGYTDVLHANRFVRAFVRRQPTIEHGLALAAQLMLAAPMRREAERRAGATTAAGDASAGGAAGSALEPLLRRGQVAIMRSGDRAQPGEVSVIDRVYAAEARVINAIGRPAEYAAFMPGVDRSDEHSRAGAELSYSMEVSIPIVTWATRYAMRLERHGAEGAGIEGDLRGARFRWDLAEKGTAETEVVYRLRQPLAQSSFLIKKLFQVDPTLDRGLNVAFALITLRAVRGRAEGWTTK
jgi:hypothetical protein